MAKRRRQAAAVPAALDVHEPAAVERVRARMAKLIASVHAAIADANRATLGDVIDAARWARFDVDSALALKGHVADLPDAHWTALRYTHREAALATLTAFLETPRAVSLVSMRNLRARLDGLITVARGLANELG